MRGRVLIIAAATLLCCGVDKAAASGSLPVVVRGGGA